MMWITRHTTSHGVVLMQLERNVAGVIRDTRLFAARARRGRLLANAIAGRRR
jgi:hypothetical protein